MVGFLKLRRQCGVSHTPRAGVQGVREEQGGHAESPRTPRQDAWGWCTGMTQRDGTGREAGGPADVVDGAVGLLLRRQGCFL